MWCVRSVRETTVLMKGTQEGVALFQYRYGWNLKNLKNFKKYVAIPSFFLKKPWKQKSSFFEFFVFFQAALLFLSVSFRTWSEGNTKK